MTPKIQARRFRKLADYIAAKPEKDFDQKLWHCGTTACVAGHCAAMNGKLVPTVFTDGRVKTVDPFVHAQKFLGLDYDTAWGLFSAEAPWQTRDAAVAELRRRAGEIDAGGSAPE